MVEMSSGSVHYEIYLKATPRADWALVEVAPDRDTGLRIAADQLREHKLGRVKVTKEKFDAETGEFRQVTIHESGYDSSQDKAKAVDPDRHPIPCVEPNDLYTMHSRRTLSRVLGNWMARHKVTPFEFLHRIDLVEKLDASGMELQHAVQKFAIAEASVTKIPVQSIIKVLHKLSDTFIDKLYKDHKANIFPTIKPETLGEVAEKLRKDKSGFYRLSGAVSLYLANSKDWSEKVDRLLNLSDAAPANSELRTFVLQPLDAILGEVVAGEAGLNELIGARKNLGTSLLSLADLFAGKVSSEPLTSVEENDECDRQRALATVKRLGEHFAAGEFAAARGAVARRILKEMKSPKRLCPNDINGEISLVRQLSAHLKTSTGPLLPAEDLHEAMVERCKQLVAGEAIDRYLSQAEDAGEELERLFQLSEQVVGKVNKRALAGYIRGHLTSPKVERHFLNDREPLAPRLKQLSHLQSLVQKCDFDEEEQEGIHSSFGILGDRIEQQEGLIASIAQNTRAGPLERAIALLKLVANAHVPAGPATSRAVQAAKILLRTDEARRTLATNQDLRKQFTTLAACIDPAA